MQASRAQGADSSARAQIKEYKKTLIIDAAASLFYERGFEKTTLDDIASALGVTKPFIYTYFRSKHHLLERLFDMVFEQFQRNISDFMKMSETDPARRFEYYVSTFIRSNLMRRDSTGLVLKEEHHLSPEKFADFRRKQRDFDTLLAALIDDGVRAGVFAVEDPALAARAISGMVRWTHRWYRPEGRLSADAICEQMTAMAMRLVGHVPGRAPARATSRAASSTPARKSARAATPARPARRAAPAKAGTAKKPGVGKTATKSAGGRAAAKSARR